MGPLTKLDVAEREINAAIGLLFDGGDPVAVVVLAAAARGIVTALCEKAGVPSFFDEMRAEFLESTKGELYRAANRHANWFKHADEDAESKLDDFKPVDADSVLFIATFDFGSVCKGKSVEAQVFEGWFLYLHGDEADLPSGLDELFPGLRGMERGEQLALGKKVLEWARTVTNFRMTYSLEFKKDEAPSGPSTSK